MSKKINIAIDGMSSTGKSTLAKALAKKLNYIYIDSGAMYRAVTYYFILNKVDLNNKEPIEIALSRIHLQFVDQQIVLNGQNVEKDIRKMEVAALVSEVAAIPQVRDFCVEQQQKLGKNLGVVMDGRDIGTVVFPDASLKIFLTAKENIRVDRRFNELIQKGEKISREEVALNLTKRDLMDSTRTYNPLRKAKDALNLDNSKLSVEGQLDLILTWVKERTN